MRKDILKKLSQELSKIDRPGSFCVSGSVPAVLPGLEVEDLGPIGLPLTAKMAKEMMKHCDQAPYGKGEKTIVDTSVRRVWRMEPDRFSLTNPDWKRFIEETVSKVQNELGLERQQLESHLYDLLLYEPGASSCLIVMAKSSLGWSQRWSSCSLHLMREAKSWSGTTDKSGRSISAALTTASFTFTSPHSMPIVSTRFALFGRDIVSAWSTI